MKPGFPAREVTAFEKVPLPFETVFISPTLTISGVSGDFPDCGAGSPEFGNNFGFPHVEHIPGMTTALIQPGDCKFGFPRIGRSRPPKMIDATNNVTRIDAVKALMNQLKLQTVQTPVPEKGGSSQAAAMTDELRTLDSSIKTGDPQKAEIALFHLRNTIRQMAVEFDSDTQLAPVVPAADEESAPPSAYA